MLKQETEKTKETFEELLKRLKQEEEIRHNQELEIFRRALSVPVE
jgi:hypothetical protein